MFFEATTFAKPAASSALFPVCHARLANTELARGPAFLAMQGAQQVDMLAKVNALSAPMASMLTCTAVQIAKPSNVARKVSFELGTASSAVVTVQVVHLANIRSWRVLWNAIRAPLASTGTRRSRRMRKPSARVVALDGMKTCLGSR